MTLDPHRSLGRPWRRLKAAIIARDGGTCQLRYRGVCTHTATTADHVTPRSKGGDDSPGNLRASCWACNDLRRARDDDDPRLPRRGDDSDGHSRRWV